MKFRDFLLKHLLADTDYLVGYDADGNYIRISRSDLAASVTANIAAPTLTVQYSANGSSWHDSYAAGDHYTRIKAGSGAWSGAIPISVSAYDIWLNAGNTGSEEDFLRSLKGEDGAGADLSELTLSSINGYSEFLQQVNAAIQNAKNAIIEEVTSTAVENTLEEFVGLKLEDITEVRNLSDGDYLTIVTSDGLRKVKIGSLSDNVAVRTVSTKVIEASVSSQLQVLTVSGRQDGENTDYTVGERYVPGTMLLFLNGQLLTLDTDYRITASGFTMLTHAPVASDVLIFEAVPK